MNNTGEKILVAKGGAGGSPVNQYNGQKGQVRREEKIHTVHTHLLVHLLVKFLSLKNMYHEKNVDI